MMTPVRDLIKEDMLSNPPMESVVVLPLGDDQVTGSLCAYVRQFEGVAVQGLRGCDRRPGVGRLGGTYGRATVMPCERGCLRFAVN